MKASIYSIAYLLQILVVGSLESTTRKVVRFQKDSDKSQHQNIPLITQPKERFQQSYFHSLNQYQKAIHAIENVIITNIQTEQKQYNAILQNRLLQDIAIEEKLKSLEKVALAQAKNIKDKMQYFCTRREEHYKATDKYTKSAIEVIEERMNAYAQQTEETLLRHKTQGAALLNLKKKIQEKELAQQIANKKAYQYQKNEIRAFHKKKKELFKYIHPNLFSEEKSDSEYEDQTPSFELPSLLQNKIKIPTHVEDIASFYQSENYDTALLNLLKQHSQPPLHTKYQASQAQKQYITKQKKLCNTLWKVITEEIDQHPLNIPYTSSCITKLLTKSNQTFIEYKDICRKNRCKEQSSKALHYTNFQKIFQKNIKQRSVFFDKMDRKFRYMFQLQHIRMEKCLTYEKKKIIDRTRQALQELDHRMALHLQEYTNEYVEEGYKHQKEIFLKLKLQEAWKVYDHKLEKALANVEIDAIECRQPCYLHDENNQIIDVDAGNVVIKK